jgi:hypothetical protein
MTIPKVPMSCDRFADVLADYLERDVDETTRTSVEAHAQSCADCGPLLADIRALRVEAENLPELAPSRDLWKEIAERIETPVVALNAAPVSTWDSGKQRRSGAWLGLAAAGLVAVTATVTYELTARTHTAVPVQIAAAATKTSPRSPSSSGATDAPPSGRVVSPDTLANVQAVAATQASTSLAASLAANRTSIERTYDPEIARLRTLVRQRRSQMDSTTLVVLEHNLKVIDDAIDQCKKALGKDPNSRFLMESLNDALDSKVQLLRTAATLPSKA